MVWKEPSMVVEEDTDIQRIIQAKSIKIRKNRILQTICRGDSTHRTNNHALTSTVERT